MTKAEKYAEDYKYKCEQGMPVCKHDVICVICAHNNAIKDVCALLRKAQSDEIHPNAHCPARLSSYTTCDCGPGAWADLIEKHFGGET